MPSLFVQEEGRRSVIPIGTDPVVVGRAADNQVVIRDRKSSRRHCRVIQVEDCYFIEDMNSSNGTTLNGSPARKAGLRHGDTIAVGEVSMVFVEDGMQPPWDGNGGTSPPKAAPKAPPKAPPRANAEKPAPAGKPDRIAEPVADPRDADEDEGMLVDPDARIEDDAPFLVIGSGPREGEQISLESVPFTIGRKPNNDLQLADNKISGTHCHVIREGGRWFIEDLESGNGVFIGKTRVQRQQLSNGERVTIGSIEVRFEGLPAVRVPGGASPSAVMKEVDGFDISEDDLSRIDIQETPASPLQAVWTVLFLALFLGVLYFGYDLFQSQMAKRTVPVNPASLIRGNPSFETPVEGGSVAGWSIDSRGDTATLTTIEEGVQHGKRALRMSSSPGGPRGFTRLLSGQNSVQTGDVFELTARVKNGSFPAAGVEILWLQKTGDEVRIVAESADLVEPGQRYSYLLLEAHAPAGLNITHCQVAVIGHGSGTLDVDDVQLLQVEGAERPPLNEIKVGDAADGPVAMQMRQDGTFSIARGKKSRVRSVRFVAPSGEQFPFGHLLSTSADPPAPRENDIVSGIFQFPGAGTKSTRVEIQAQPVGEQIKVTWRVLSGVFREGMEPGLVVELEGSAARDPLEVYGSGRKVAEINDLDDLTGLRCDEWVIGQTKTKIVMMFSAPVELEVLPESRRRGAVTVFLKLQALDIDTLELFVARESRREETRRQGIFDGVRRAIETRQYGRAYGLVAGLKSDFGHVPETRREAEALETRLDAIGKSAIAELQRILEDRTRYPSAPVRDAFVHRAEETIAAFEGTPVAAQTQKLLDPVLNETRRGVELRDRANAERVLQLGRNQVGAGCDAVARFYFQWVADQWPKTREAEIALQQIRLIEERK